MQGMQTRRRLSAVLVSLSLATALIAGCSSGSQQSSGPLPDATTLVKQSADTTKNVKSAHLVLSVQGKVVSGDAMFTHRDVCAAVIDGEGDYVLPVKENQPTLRANIAAVFAEPKAGLSPPPDHAF